MNRFSYLLCGAVSLVVKVGIAAVLKNHTLGCIRLVMLCKMAISWNADSSYSFRSLFPLMPISFAFCKQGYGVLTDTCTIAMLRLNHLFLFASLTSCTLRKTWAAGRGEMHSVDPLWINGFALNHVGSGSKSVVTESSVSQTSFTEAHIGKLHKVCLNVKLPGAYGWPLTIQQIKLQNKTADPMGNSNLLFYYCSKTACCIRSD